MNKNGDFILEFSVDEESGKRLFYGLKKNGRYFFPNENPTKEVELSSKTYDGRTVVARYESMNAFISLKDDISYNKQYLFSLSTYFCFMELYDFSQEEVQSSTTYTKDYFSTVIFSFRFSLLETKLNNKMTYFLVFSHKDGEEQKGEYFSIKKMQFSDINFNKNDIISNPVYKSKLNDRSISAFLIDDVDDSDYKILVVIFISDSGKYNFNVYSLSDLSEKCKDQQLYEDVLTTNQRGDGGKGYGLYFQTIYLGDKDVAMAYYTSNAATTFLRFQVLTIRKSNSVYVFDNKIYTQTIESFNTDLVLNDFIKITDTRLAVITSTDGTKFHIIIMDLYNNRYNLEKRIYSYSISPHNIAKELAAHIYNGYLGFSTTIQKNGVYSIFMLFGFANGTDFTINIYPHLMDTGYYTSGNDLVTELLKYIKIDNNIFGYVAVEKIVLVSYPKELLFYKNEGDTTLLANGTIIDSTHILKQNKALNKTSELYYLIFYYYF